MPVGNCIALFGFGHIRRTVVSALINKEPKGQDNYIDFSQLEKVIFEEKGLSLTDIYKKVQHKYYPEKDIFKKNA